MHGQNYGVIIAGGRGTRFWPLSRPDRPKQLLKILGRKSLIQETVHRVLPLFGRENLLVVTVAEHYGAVRRELAYLPKANFLIEPQGNNTAPCIGLAALEVSSRDPEGVMTVLPADHWIAGSHTFSRTVRAAAKLAQSHDALVTIGIRPNFPETGFGYILKGKKIKGPASIAAYRVRGFKEKPSLQKARRLLQSGSLWNSGIFVWRASTILASLQSFSPSIFAGLKRIQRAAPGAGLGAPQARLRTVLQTEYRKMPNLSIDYAVLEKAGSEGRVLTVEGKFAWSDVGSWAAVHRMLARDGRGNAGLGQWVGFRSNHCLAYSSGRLIALMGMENAVVIDTPDAVLVGDLRRAQEVKDLVEELERQGYRKYTR